MPEGTASFDLNATVQTIVNGLGVVFASVGFDAAIHGLVLACIIGVMGLTFIRQNRPTGRPLMKVCKKMVIFCGVLALPGVFSLIMSGHLPAPGEMKINSIGLICFWSLVIAHLCMEEMNFQWFAADK